METLDDDAWAWNRLWELRRHSGGIPLQQNRHTIASAGSRRGKEQESVATKRAIKRIRHFVHYRHNVASRALLRIACLVLHRAGINISEE